MSGLKTCRLCGLVGHLAHYCPESDGPEKSQETVQWLAKEEDKDDEDIVQDLSQLLMSGGWLSRIRALCRLCTLSPERLQLANDWRDGEGFSLLSLAIRLNLRNSVHVLWANGIHCGINQEKTNNYFILMKMCDACHHEVKYDWFTGTSEIAARLDREGAMIDAYVRVSLIWNCTDDLDLHVICPSGEEIYYQHKRSQCGGELDVDMNASDPYSRAPVENVVWAQSEAPVGEYRVIVNNYCHRARLQEVPFVVEVAIQGKQPVSLNGCWRASDGEGNRALIHQFWYDPSEANTQDEEDEDEEDEKPHLVPSVQHMNKLAGTKGSNDTGAQLAWLVIRERDIALFDVFVSLGLHQSRGGSCVSPQWCFLQAIWAHNLPAAELLLSIGSGAIDVNFKYRWDVIPWDESVAQMCWRECHGHKIRDRPWMKALSWLAGRGADFSQVKLNFHRWRKPSSMQESQMRTFSRLIWHLSDENGWNSESKAAAGYLGKVVRQLAYWGAQIPEDLDPDFEGDTLWGVNGRRPLGATTYCHGQLNVAFVHVAVRAGKSTSRKQVMAVLCSFKKACPELHGSLRCHILQFLYPNLGRGRLAYHQLQTSEGGVTSRTGQVAAHLVDRASVPPRGYVCGRCRQAGHWRQFCPRAA